MAMPLEGQEKSGARVVEESAVIVWDAARRTQHFIRRATFDAKGKSIGFLVPTPSVPQLAEADNSVFEQAAAWTLPERRAQKRWRIRLRTLFGRRIQNTFKAASSRMEVDGESVDVLHTQSVAGYDASVLAARDAGALGRWLQSHGYASSPELIDWLKPYVARDWKITAFKIAKPKSGSGERHFGSQAVRMSFQADAPFFPYREPPSQRQKSAEPALSARVSPFHAADERRNRPGIARASLARAHDLGERSEREPLARADEGFEAGANDAWLGDVDDGVRGPRHAASRLRRCELLARG
jgi:hypothetical protein